MHIVVVRCSDMYNFLCFFVSLFGLVLLPGSVDGVNDLAHHGRIRQRRGVTQAVFLAAQDLAQNTAHDLTTAGLGEIFNDEDGLGGSKWSNRLADLHDEILLTCSLVSLPSLRDTNALTA